MSTTTGEPHFTTDEPGDRALIHAALVLLAEQMADASPLDNLEHEALHRADLRRVQVLAARYATEN
jgi:hypothetical protein